MFQIFPNYTAEYDEKCQAISYNGMYGQISELQHLQLFDTIDALTVITVFSALSVFLSLCVILTTMYNPKLNVHPYRLITMITCIDASYIVLFITYPNICTLKLPELFIRSVY